MGHKDVTRHTGECTPTSRKVLGKPRAKSQKTELPPDETDGKFRPVQNFFINY